MTGDAIIDHVHQQLDAIAQASDLGAFVDVDVEAALAAAWAARARLATGAAARSLEGVTVGVKSNIAVAGLPWTAGIAAYRGRIAETDAPVVARLRAAGAIILGTTAMAEGAFGATTDNPAYGRCHNPHAPGYTTGGSSGGSAAAVAAGLCDAALGTDTMGSVRLPSAYCGVVGFKPARGVIPDADIVPLSPSLDVTGVHAADLAGAARMMVPFAPVMAAAEIGVVGVMARDACAAPAAIWDAVDAAEARLRAAGVATRRVDLAGLYLGTLRRRALLLVETEVAAVHADLLAGDEAGVSPGFRQAMAWAVRQPAAALADAHRVIADACTRLIAAWSGCDAIVLPTTQQQAFAFDEDVPANAADLTVLANLLDWSAVSVPGGMSGGLPVGVQVLAREAAMVFGVAGCIEIAPPLLAYWPRGTLRSPVIVSD